MTNLEFYKEEIKHKFELFKNVPEEMEIKTLGSIFGWAYYNATGNENPNPIEVFEWLCEKHGENKLNGEETKVVSKMKEVFSITSISLECEEETIREIDESNSKRWKYTIIQHLILTGYKGGVPIVKYDLPSDLKFSNISHNLTYTLEELGL